MLSADDLTGALWAHSLESVYLTFLMQISSPNAPTNTLNINKSTAKQKSATSYIFLKLICEHRYGTILANIKSMELVCDRASILV